MIDTITKLDGAVQAAVAISVEVEGSEKPAAVAEAIVRCLGIEEQKVHG